MLQSFFVYGFFGLALTFLGQISAKRQFSDQSRGEITPFWVWDIWLAIAIFAFLSGIRWQVGVDHLAYLENYLTYKNKEDFLFEKEWGFEFITGFFASLDAHFTLYFSFLAFLQIYFLYKAFKEERNLLPFLGIVIIFGPFYLDMMNGIRQMIVASVFVFSIKFIVERKFLKYLIIILLAALMHKSALLLLVFYFLPLRDLYKNKWMTLGLLCIAFVLGGNTELFSFLKNLGDFFQFLGYETFTSDRIGSLIEEEVTKNFGPRRFTILLIGIMTIWYSPGLKRTFNHHSFTVYYNLAITGIILSFLLVDAHHIILRPISYLTIFSAVTTSYLLLYLWPTIRTKKFLNFFIVLILSLTYLSTSIVADHGKREKDYTNFKFFWEHTL